MPQKITVGTTGADSRRVLEALTPLTGAAAPAVNATYIGQTYITTAGALYISIAVGSEVPANDWTMVTLLPLTGILAPAVHATFIGQMFVDTVAAKVYVAVATDSVSAADDWQAVTNAA